MVVLRAGRRWAPCHADVQRPSPPVPGCSRLDPQKATTFGLVTLTVAQTWE